MSKEEWVKEAKERIEGARQVVEEMDNMSSCDKYWSRAKHDGENAIALIKFLQTGIRLIEG